MRNVVAAAAATLVSGILCYACSSGAPSSLDTKTPLSGLTTEERKQYCEDHGHYMSSHVSDADRKKIGCAVAARGGAGGGAAATRPAMDTCKNMYDDCMKGPTPAQKTACEKFPAAADDCSATVGEANDCAEAQADALGKIAGKADDACKDLSKPLLATEERGAKHEACGRLQRLCPKVYDNLFNEPALLGTAAQPQPAPTEDPLLRGRHPAR